MTDNIFKGFGLGHYRSFSSEEISMVGPFDNMHLLAGQNNAGKSALLDFADRVLPKLVNGPTIQGKQYPFLPEDIPQGMDPDGESYIVSLCFDRETVFSRGIRNLHDEKYIGQLHDMLSSDVFSRGSQSSFWVDFRMPMKPESASTHQKAIYPMTQFQMFKDQGGVIDLSKISSIVTSIAGPEDSNFSNIMAAITPWTSIPQTIKIEAIRKTEYIENADPHARITGGAGLGQKLLALKEPQPENHTESMQRYSRFLALVRNVLNDPSAEILVPFDAKTINVKTQGTDYLPLSALGTGIEELIIIAAVVACNSDTLICIEEPEIHLHPALQAKLLHYLRADDRNRFLIATHSQTFINSPDITVTHVTKDERVSHTAQMESMLEARGLLEDLGARASDILQSNYVIWVEGPSDRVYINYWLSQTDKQLQEGIHYSIMLYGGKLLNSLDASLSSNNEKLINLFRINTHFCVLMDSDKGSSREHISTTKQRIKRECLESGGLPIVTAFRTIENYVPGDVLESAIEETYPSKKYEHKLNDSWLCPLGFSFTGTTIRPDKIKISRAVVKLGFEQGKELRKQMRQLTDDIRKANGFAMQ